MKKIILLVFVTLFCCVGYSQAQTTKKMTRQEKKEAQKAMEQALFEEARQAIENKAFTLEADRVIFKRGRNAFVSSNTNFVMVDGDKSSVQVNPEKPDVPLNKNDAFQKVQKRRVQEKR